MGKLAKQKGAVLAFAPILPKVTHTARDHTLNSRSTRKPHAIQTPHYVSLARDGSAKEKRVLGETLTMVTITKTKPQTRRMSFLEANTNSFVGLIISYLFTYFALPIFGLHPDPLQAGYITLGYFCISVIRGYIIRRAFNLLQIGTTSLPPHSIMQLWKPRKPQ